MTATGFQDAKALTTKKTCEKLSKKKSWLWDRLKTDPEFPKPIYLSPGAPVWLEHELDAYLEKCAARRIGREGASAPHLESPKLIEARKNYWDDVRAGKRPHPRKRAARSRNAGGAK